MSPTVWLVIYCVLVVIASLAGGWIPILVRLTHERLELALSFISGVMLGVAVLLLLPHAVATRMEASPAAALAGGEAHEVVHLLLAPVMISLLAGFLAMFLIERFFSFHHHAAPDDATSSPAETFSAADRHDHLHESEHQPQQSHSHALRWSGATIGLTLHSLLDGVALAASVAAATHRPDHDDGHSAGLLAGFGTFLVILLHKPFDSLTLGTLMARGSHPRSFRHLINALYALLVPIGAALFMLGLTAGDSQSSILSIALAFAAGTFLCIALSDLLPELQFHSHDRGKLSMALLAGLALAWGISLLEARVH